MATSGVAFVPACVSDIGKFADAFDRALAQEGPSLLDVDMTTIGPYATACGGPTAGAAGGAK